MTWNDLGLHGNCCYCCHKVDIFYPHFPLTLPDFFSLAVGSWREFACWLSSGVSRDKIRWCHATNNVVFREKNVSRCLVPKTCVNSPIRFIVIWQFTSCYFDINGTCNWWRGRLFSCRTKPGLLWTWTNFKFAYVIDRVSLRRAIVVLVFTTLPPNYRKPIKHSFLASHYPPYWMNIKNINEYR